MDDYTKRLEEREREREEKELEKKLQLNRERKWIFKLITYLASIFALFMIAILGFGPIYAVWAQRLSGEAELARAESNRQIRVLEARAEQEAAKALAEAEVIRAEGVSKCRPKRSSGD